MWNASEESLESFLPTIIGFVVNMTLFCGLACFIVRGLTSRKGAFSSFRSILVGIFMLGILLFVQFLLDQSILNEMTDIGIDLYDIGYSFLDVIYYVYFLGIFAIGFVFSRNRRDAKQWFPAKK